MNTQKRYSPEFPNDLNSQPAVDVFYDGKPATMTDDIQGAPRYTLLQVFKIPLMVLGAGVLLTLFAAAIVVLKNNSSLASALERIAIEKHQSVFATVLKPSLLP